MPVEYCEIVVFGSNEEAVERMSEKSREGFQLVFLVTIPGGFKLRMKRITDGNA